MAAAAGVLLHADLLPLVGQFQDGENIDMHPLRSFASQSQRSLSYLELGPQVSYFNAELTSTIDGFRALLLPWLRDYGLVRLPRLLASMAPIMEAFVLVQAVVHGDEAMVAWLFQHSCVTSSSAYPLVDVASWANQLSMLAFLHRDLPTVRGTANAMDIAARDGHLPIVEFLHRHRTEGCSPQAINLAARFNHLNIVMFLHENRSEGCTTDALVWAAAHGHLDMVRFLLLHDHPGLHTPAAMDSAAQHGYLAVVQLLHDMGQTCTTNAMDYAALNGHLDVLVFLHTHRTEGATTRATSFAAAAGHFQVVRFLREHKYAANLKTALQNARKNGHVDIARYLSDSSDLMTGYMGVLAMNV
ncbi:Aste57867_9642 [Aphanomyces stellatus]|uniref:Aste57867_9642 protein n=1 Tax=Aphanomyces stellatus TaxID=120398 RepID=A0A485KNW1_9STRA|nr:hypothetical protein As57867_009604 [Aphanomyces stellatus]VFT86521.1 Aste57867_9642 [Aphanomyces stellatus]